MASITSHPAGTQYEDLTTRWARAGNFVSAMGIPMWDLVSEQVIKRHFEVLYCRYMLTFFRVHRTGMNDFSVSNGGNDFS